MAPPVETKGISPPDYGEKMAAVAAAHGKIGESHPPLDISIRKSESIAMDQTEGADGRRRDPRYVEESRDLSDWIQVRIVRQFGPPVEASGLLIDLTPRAVRIGFPELKGEQEIVFSVGLKLLVTFRFRDLMATTASGTVSRIDALPNGQAIVLFFDFIREENRAAIEAVCKAYQATRSGKGTPGTAA